MTQPVKRSTLTLVSGLLLTPVGLLLLRHADSLDEFDPAYTSSTTWGGICLLVGVPLLLVGVVRLSRNVDLAAEATQRTAADDGAPASLPGDAPSAVPSPEEPGDDGASPAP